MIYFSKLTMCKASGIVLEGWPPGRFCWGPCPFFLVFSFLSTCLSLLFRSHPVSLSTLHSLYAFPSGLLSLVSAVSCSPAPTPVNRLILLVYLTCRFLLVGAISPILFTLVLGIESFRSRCLYPVCFLFSLVPLIFRFDPCPYFRTVYLCFFVQLTRY